MVFAMKIADTSSEAPFRVRVNRTGRRTFSREYKLEIVQECSAPGVSVAAVALAHRINANQVRKWIVEHRAGRLCPVPNGTPTMLPVTLAATDRCSPVVRAQAAASATKRCAAGVIEVEFDKARIRVRGAVDGEALRTVLDALASR
jgi:transposase